MEYGGDCYTGGGNHAIPIGFLYTPVTWRVQKEEATQVLFWGTIVETVTPAAVITHLLLVLSILSHKTSSERRGNSGVIFLFYYLKGTGPG